jgi:hypothetical protein
VTIPRALLDDVDHLREEQVQHFHHLPGRRCRGAGGEVPDVHEHDGQFFFHPAETPLTPEDLPGDALSNVPAEVLLEAPLAAQLRHHGVESVDQLTELVGAQVVIRIAEVPGRHRPSRGAARRPARHQPPQEPRRDQPQGDAPARRRTA